MKLNIGSGSTILEDHINVDIRCIREVKGLDVVASIVYLPFRDCCFNEVFAHHILEHLDKYTWKKGLSEIVRVAMINGLLNLHVPNLLNLFSRLEGGGEDDSGLMEGIYGGQYFKEDYHRWGYTFRMFKSFFDNNGVEVVTDNWSSRKWDFCVLGKKVKRVSKSVGVNT